MEKPENNSVRLLKKWQRGFLNLLFSRMLIIVIFLLIQFALLFSALSWLRDFLPHIIGGQFILIFCMVLQLLNSALDPSAKITWLVLIMIAPVFGCLLYLFSLREIGHRAMRKRVAEKIAETIDTLPQREDVLAKLDRRRAGVSSMAHYVHKSGGYPIYQNTTATYFPSGEAKFQQLLAELAQAKRFIFLEYFIVEEGAMWGQILDILIRKAAEGVDVRILYDGTCEFVLLPKGYSKKLSSLGIQCKVFAPFTPMFSTHYNFRDHRKVAIIDGHTAFNGGINLAEEYINCKPRYGHWKDTAIMLKGDAVRSFTLMFLQIWNLSKKETDFAPFLSPVGNAPATQGFVMPYGDQPLDNHQIGKQVYLDILNRAQRSVYIMTPYLILDAELENALKYAAQRGVAVKIVLPGIPDKKIPYALAKTHYASLISAGVEIFEYTPGFVHAKVFLCDDAEAVVGTINLDYRSLYHHFECATYLYDCACISDIRADFADTLSLCRQIDTAALKSMPRWELALGRILKPFAPLL